MKIKILTIPNLITCLNLACGCFAVLMAVRLNFLWAFSFVLLAAVFDYLDGFAARLLKSYSEIGKELDSLADMVSFGVAPSFILLGLISGYSNASELSVVSYGVFLVAIFSALRLAKFNVDTRQSTEFIGLPTPANAILISSAAFIASGEDYSWLHTLAYLDWAVVGFGAVLSFLLVSEIPMFSLKMIKFGLNGNKLRYGFIVYSVLLLILLHLVAVPLIIVSYIVISVVRNFLLSLQRKNR